MPTARCHKVSLQAPGHWQAILRCITIHDQKSSCEWARRAGSAQGTVPSGLHGSAATIGCFSQRPEAPTCHSGRAQPARLAAESVPRAPEGRRWPAVMTPKHGGLRADDAVASQGAADGTGPSIQGARTHTHGTSRGAAAVLRPHRSAMPKFSARAGAGIAQAELLSGTSIHRADKLGLSTDFRSRRPLAPLQLAFGAKARSLFLEKGHRIESRNRRMAASDRRAPS